MYLGGSFWNIEGKVISEVAHGSKKAMMNHAEKFVREHNVVRGCFNLSPETKGNSKWGVVVDGKLTWTDTNPSTVTLGTYRNIRRMGAPDLK